VILVKLSAIALYTMPLTVRWQVKPVILGGNFVKSFFMVLPFWVLWFLCSLINITRIWGCQMWCWVRFHQPCYILRADVQYCPRIRG
jgi:hypothetical protein